MFLYLERALQCVTNIPQVKIIQDVQHGGGKMGFVSDYLALLH